MPSAIIKIRKEATDGSNTFICSVYASVQDIINHKPIDCWECHRVIVDPDTMTYLDDQRILEKLLERSCRENDPFISDNSDVLYDTWTETESTPAVDTTGFDPKRD